MILMNEFGRRWEETGPAERTAFERVGRSGWYILGSEVARFEAALAEWWGLPYCCGVASGLDAIELGLAALGCGPGDKVLTTPLSAFATTLAILRRGAVPVFVDTDASGLVDLGLAERACVEDPSIRFFVPVHLYGHALDLPRLKWVRDRFSLGVVEDCAQAIGACFDGVPVGTVGQAAAVSFYPTKNLGALGDGGAVLTRQNEIWRKVGILRDYGQTGRYEHQLAGINSRLDELQAAVMHDAFLPRLADWTERRRTIATLYLKGISGPGIQPIPVPEGSESCWHLFPVLVPAGERKAVRNRLERAGIATGEHYPFLIPAQPALLAAPHLVASSLDRAQELANREMSLPIHSYLTDTEVTTVIDAVREQVLIK